MDKGKAFEKFFNRLDFSNGIPETGKLLISEPFLEDPNFNHTVILLVRHDSEGSVGFVLNQPSQFNIDEVVEGFPPFEASVSIGGPVGVNSLFFIHRLGPLLENSLKIMDGLYWGGDFGQLKEMAKSGDLHREDILFFLGYSGWAADQLTEEIKSDSWIITETTADEVMTQSGKGMWSDVLKKRGENFKIISNFPNDPKLN